MRRHARRCLGAASVGRGSGRRRRGTTRPDRVDRIARHEEDAAARDSGTGEYLLRRAFRSAAAVGAVRQLDLAQHLRAICLRTHDEEAAAVRANVDLAVGEHGRRLLRVAEPAGPELSSGVDVERAQHRAAVDLVQTCAVQDGGGEARTRALDVAHFVVLMSPVCEPSIAAIRPSSLPSRFSSPCETKTVLPLTATPVLIARLAAGNAPHFFTGLRLDGVAWRRRRGRR